MSNQAFQRTSYYVAFAAALAIALVLWTAQYEFGGYDLSALIDVSWRLKLGQVPYRDFPTMLPPLFYLLGGAAFSIFGVFWRSLFLLNAIVYLLLLAAGWNVLRTSVDTRHNSQIFAAFFLALTAPFLVTGHLWHSALTGMFGVTFLLAITVSFRDLERAGSLINVTTLTAIFLAAGLYMGKPNTSGPLIVLAFLFPVFSKLRRKGFLALSLVLFLAADIAGLVLLACHLNPLQVVHSYLHVSGRPTVYERLFGDLPYLRIPFLEGGLTLPLVDAFLSYLLLIVALYCGLLCAFRVWRLPGFVYAAAICGCVVSAAGFATDWDTRFNDIAPACFGVLLMTIYAPDSSRRELREARRLARIVLWSVGLGAVLLCVSRARMQGIGPWAGRPYGRWMEVYQDKFFGTLHARDEFWRVLTYTDQVVAAAPGQKIFFGPRLEFQYARLGITPAKGIPDWWHPGSSFSIEDDPRVIDAWNRASFDLVFLYDVITFPELGGYTRFPKPLIQKLESDYVLISDPDAPVRVYSRKR